MHSNQSMGIFKITTYSLMVCMVFSFGFATDAMAKSKRKKRIVQIKMTPKPKKAIKKKKRVKREKPLLVKDKRDHDVEIEPLRENQKVSHRGLKKFWKKKKYKKKKKIKMEANSLKRYQDPLDDEDLVHLMPDRDINSVLQNMRDFSDTEFSSEYEGSL